MQKKNSLSLKGSFPSSPPGPLDPKNGMEDPVVKEIAKKHGKSPAQVKCSRCAGVCGGVCKWYLFKQKTSHFFAS